MTLNFNHAYNIHLRKKENSLFFKQWIKHPGRLGTLAPISVRLATSAAAPIDTNERVVEIGAGTGRLTRALLEKGIHPHNLAVIELDSSLTTFLKKTLPGLYDGQTPFPHIIEGDATYLDTLIPAEWVGTVDTVVSAIPLMYLEKKQRLAIIDAAFNVLKPGGRIIHVTYSPKSPIEFSTAINQTRTASLWMNIPPGFVWTYTQKEATNAQTEGVTQYEAQRRYS